MAIEKLIPLEKVKGLREILGDDHDGINEFKKTENLVKAHLFSRYKERKAYAKQTLSEIWQSPIEVYTLTQSDLIYVYINFNNIEAYFFIEKYPTNTFLIEEVPDKTEINAWKLLIQ